MENDSSKQSLLEKLKVYYPVLLFLPLITLISGDVFMLLVNQVLVITDFGLEEEGFQIMGLIIGITLIVSAFSTFAFGYLADKYQRKRLMFIGGLIWSISEILVALTPRPNWIWLMTFRMTGAIGAGCSTPVSMSLLSDIFKSKERGNSFAWWGVASMIGGLGGGSIALAFNKIDFIADDTIPLSQRIAEVAAQYAGSDVLTYWRNPFLLMGILGLICTALIIFAKEPKRGRAEAELEQVLEKEDVDYSNTYRIKKEDLKYIYKRKSNFWLIINGLDTIYSGFITGFIFTWLEHELGLDVKDIFPQLGLILPFLLVLIPFIIVGQFVFARMGDKKVKSGDPAGRVKIAVFCGVMYIPFLLLTFGAHPNLELYKIWGMDLSNNYSLFFGLFLLVGITLGFGLAFIFGIGPSWYASILDVNLPEHRGTMIAAASFVDALGRGFGAIFGGSLIQRFDLLTNTPITDAMIFITLTFGIASAILWLPILKYCKKDFQEIKDILAERAKTLEEKAEIKEQIAMEEKITDANFSERTSNS